jgi:ankyrin repeat protein
VPGPEQGADEFQQVALADGEILADAQQIQPGQGQTAAQPDRPGNSAFHQQAGQRYQHNVQAGNERRLAGGGVQDADLLQGCGGKQDQAGGHAGGQHGQATGWRRDRRLSAEKPDQRQQRQSAQGEPDAVEGKGAQMIHPDPLGDKGQPPDGGGG